MSRSDIAVLAVLALIAGWPLVRMVWAKVGLKLPSAAQPEPWNQGWVRTLITLQSELEKRPDQAESVKLCRQLIWLLVGGEPIK